MIVDINDLFDNCYRKKNNLTKINNKSTKYRDYKKNYNIMKLKLVSKYADNINKKFLEDSLKDKRNKCIVSCIDNYDIDFYNISGVVVFRKTLNTKDKLRYIILVIAAHPKIRGLGYGTMIMDELCDFLTKKNKKTELILHSLKSSYNFYIKYGFHEIQKNSFLERYEKVDVNDFILLKFVIPKVEW